MKNAILEWWEFIVGGVGLVVWLVRLENKIIMNKRELDLHKKNCLERHFLDNEGTKEFKRSLDKLFDLVREVREDVKEIRGWKDGIQGK